MVRLLYSLLAFLLLVSNASAQYSSELSHYLFKDVAFLSHDSLEGREMGTSGELIAARYISQRYDSIGLEFLYRKESYELAFSATPPVDPHEPAKENESITGRNIIGVINRNVRNTIIIGAHYDHLGWGGEGSGSLSTAHAVHNGADDNASGVASLLYLAQQLQKHKANLHHNVIFIAFTGEEKGLLGSNHFAKTFLNDSINVSFMINMDMVGRLDSARRLAIYGIGSSPDFSEPLHSIQEPKFTFVMDSSGIGPSDHTSFYLNDIPVLHFFTGQHEQYHRPEDDLEHINFEGLKDVSDFIFQLVLRLDKKADLTFTETKSSEKQDQRRKFKVTLGVIPDYLYDGEGLKIDGVKEGRTADLAGMKRGDIVVQLGSLSITNIYDYMHALQEFEPGTEATALIVRNGEEIKLDIVFDATTGEHSNH